MTYTDEQLKEAELYAQVLDVQDLADVLQLPRAQVDLALVTEADPLCAAIKRGRLRAKAELRLGLLKLAAQGSNPAQLQVDAFLKQLTS